MWNPFRKRAPGSLRVGDDVGGEIAVPTTLLEAFPDVEPAVIESLLKAHNGDAAMVSNAILETIGTNQLPPLKECMICLTEPRQTRFNCGHACCCAECTAILLAPGNAKCPNCRKPITSTITGDDENGVPIARQPTFEPPKGRGGVAPNIAATSSVRLGGCVRRMRVRLFECFQGLAPEAWRGANRLWQRILAPLTLMLSFMSVIFLVAQKDALPSPPSPPSPPPAPPHPVLLPSSLPLPPSPRLPPYAYMAWPSERSSEQDALATLCGALAACAWHGVRLRVCVASLTVGGTRMPVATTVARVGCLTVTLLLLGFVSGALSRASTRPSYFLLAYSDASHILHPTPPL